MSYSLPDTWSYESMLDYNARTSASLGALAGMEETLGHWTDLRGKTRTARDERDNDRWALLSAGAIVDVHDTNWDHVLVDLSGRAFLAAGKDSDAEPYGSLFGTVTAKDAVNYGPAKATVLGSKILARGKELAHPDLAGALAALEMANARLAEAGTAREAAEEKALLHEIRRRKLLAEYVGLVADSEVAILTRYRGRGDLVRAALAPPRPKKKGKDASDAKPHAQD